MQSTSETTAFDLLSESDDKSANLRVRADLMDRLIGYIEENDLTQKEAAEQLGASQPRISYLVNGRISKFTIDALLNMCEHAGIDWELDRDDLYAGRPE